MTRIEYHTCIFTFHNMMLFAYIFFASEVFVVLASRDREGRQFFWTGGALGDATSVPRSPVFHYQSCITRRTVAAYPNLSPFRSHCATGAIRGVTGPDWVWACEPEFPGARASDCRPLLLLGLDTRPNLRVNLLALGFLFRPTLSDYPLREQFGVIFESPLAYSDSGAARNMLLDRAWQPGITYELDITALPKCRNMSEDSLRLNFTVPLQPELSQLPPFKSDFCASEGLGRIVPGRVYTLHGRNGDRSELILTTSTNHTKIYMDSRVYECPSWFFYFSQSLAEILLSDDSDLLQSCKLMITSSEIEKYPGFWMFSAIALALTSSFLLIVILLLMIWRRLKKFCRRKDNKTGNKTVNDDADAVKLIPRPTPESIRREMESNLRDLLEFCLKVIMDPSAQNWEEFRAKHAQVKGKIEGLWEDSNISLSITGDAYQLQCFPLRLFGVMFGITEGSLTSHLIKFTAEKQRDKLAWAIRRLEDIDPKLNNWSFLDALSEGTQDSAEGESPMSLRAVTKEELLKLKIHAQNIEDQLSEEVWTNFRKVHAETKALLEQFWFAPNISLSATASMLDSSANNSSHAALLPDISPEFDLEGCKVRLRRLETKLSWALDTIDQLPRDLSDGDFRDRLNQSLSSYTSDDTRDEVRGTPIHDHTDATGESTFSDDGDSGVTDSTSSNESVARRGTRVAARPGTDSGHASDCTPNIP